MTDREITKKDGKKYTVRNDRSRFFYPQEWLDFLKTFIGGNKDERK